jgi:hypothetical protein
LEVAVVLKSTVTLVLLMLILAAGLSRAANVETYTSSGVIHVNLPGTVSSGKTIFDGSFTFSTLNFAPGSVTFNGQPVDFDGHESQFMSGAYSGQAVFPTTGGPATVNTQEYLVMSGAVSSTGSGGNGSVRVGSSFGPNSFDVVSGQSISSSGSIPNWKSSAVPNLNGMLVSVISNSTLTSVDVAHGLVNTSGSGTISATMSVPGVPWWGILMLIIGLMGMGAVVLFGRRVSSLRHAV